MSCQFDSSIALIWLGDDNTHSDTSNRRASSSMRNTKLSLADRAVRPIRFALGILLGQVSKCECGAAVDVAAVDVAAFDSGEWMGGCEGAWVGGCVGGWRGMARRLLS